MISAINQKTNSRKIRNIVVHCTASNQNEKVEDIQAYWKNVLKWKSPGYHYIIDRFGNIFPLQPETLPSNGVAGYNKDSIHISYIGGIDPTGKPIDNRTSHQKNALAVSLKILIKKYPGSVIKGHRDFSPDKNGNGKVDYWERIKACPCFDAIEEYKDIK